MQRIAVVGAGHWGPNLIRNFHNRPVSEVAFVVDRDEKRLAEVKKRFPDIQVTTELGAALKDATVTGVVVATPTATHFELTRQVLQAGKHVLVEKPLCQRAEEAKTLVALAAKQKCLLMVGHVFLFNGVVKKVKEIMRADDFGPLHYVSMVRTNLGPIRTDVDAAYDLAAHDISIANEWLDARPISVTATGGSWINPGVADAVFVTFKYPGNVLVHMHASWLSPRKVRDITVVGERRMLTFDDMNMLEPVRIYDKQVTDKRTQVPYLDTYASFRSSVREGDIIIPKMPGGEPLKTECDHFLQCLNGQKPLRSDGNTGLAVVQALQALEKSALEGGREVEVEA